MVSFTLSWFFVLVVWYSHTAALSTTVEKPIRIALTRESSMNTKLSKEIARQYHMKGEKVNLRPYECLDIPCIEHSTNYKALNDFCDMLHQCNVYSGFFFNIFFKDLFSIVLISSPKVNIACVFLLLFIFLCVYWYL